MHQKLSHKLPALVNRKGPVLLQDNARLYVSIINRQELHTLKYEVLDNNLTCRLDHPPHSPDFSPTYFHFFIHLDNFLLEKCFKNLKDAETAFSEFIASRTIAFYDTGIKNLFLSDKSVSKLMIHFLINKICFYRIYFFFNLTKQVKHFIYCNLIYTVCPKKVVTRFYFLTIRDKWKV